MCLIIAKPASAKLPTLETFFMAHSVNPHGMGYMFVKDGVVIGKKGFTDPETFYLEVQQQTTGLPAVLHFRFATHGTKEPTATHPFPVSTDLADLCSLFWQSSAGVAHNGVIKGYGSNLYSDTQEYIADVLSLPGLEVWLNEEETLQSLAESTNSRFAFLLGKGEIALAGDFQWREGCAYSNLHHSDEQYECCEEKISLPFCEGCNQLFWDNLQWTYRCRDLHDVPPCPLDHLDPSWDNCFYCDHYDYSKVYRADECKLSRQYLLTDSLDLPF